MYASGSSPNVYDKHIQALPSSCISKLGQIGRVKHNFDQPTLATIIDTLVMSKIYYCSTVSSDILDSNINNIQLIQNCAARLITGVAKYDYISQTLKVLGWLPIKEHLLYRDALLTFKCMNYEAPQCMILLNNETEFITEILEEMQIWIFQNSDLRAVIPIYREQDMEWSRFRAEII